MITLFCLFVCLFCETKQKYIALRIIITEVQANLGIIIISKTNYKGHFASQ